jgi:hypothetical protein
VSHISSDADIVAPHHSHAWRDAGVVRATVRMGGGTLYFDSAADARAVAAACAEAADAMDRAAAAPGE